MTSIHPPQYQASTEVGQPNTVQSPEIPPSVAVDFTAVPDYLPEVRSRASSAHQTGKPHRPLRVRRRATSAPVPTVLLPPEIRCQYKGKLCRNERTFKDDGERHTLCELHRQRANANQRRWQKKHQHKVRRRRAAAAQGLTRAMPHARAPPQTINDGEDHDDGDDDWIDPLFDDLIAKLNATSEAQTVSLVRIPDCAT
jgi:hypothetical protein